MIFINQIIKTIQGELTGIGRPIILVRFTGCNLRCSWCDAYEASHKGIIALDDKSVVIKTIKEHKGNLDTILLTGGEPFLYIHQDNKDFFNELSYLFRNIILETNGINSEERYEPEYIKEMFPGSQVRINCSPKLNLDAYSKLNLNDKERIYQIYDKTIPVIMKNDHYIIKMVYREDYEEDILNFRDRYKIPHDRFSVLPYTPIKQTDNFLNAFKESCIKTISFCLRENIIYSPREHIFIYLNNKAEHIDII